MEDNKNNKKRIIDNTLKNSVVFLKKENVGGSYWGSFKSYFKNASDTFKFNYLSRSLKTKYLENTKLQIFHNVFDLNNKEDKKNFENFFKHIIFFSYRKNFPEQKNIKTNANYNSDCGWGCMIRSGQMILAKAIYEIIRYGGEEIISSLIDTISCFIEFPFNINQCPPILSKYKANIQFMFSNKSNNKKKVIKVEQTQEKESKEKDTKEKDLKEKERNEKETNEKETKGKETNEKETNEKETKGKESEEKETIEKESKEKEVKEIELKEIGKETKKPESKINNTPLEKRENTTTQNPIIESIYPPFSIRNICSIGELVKKSSGEWFSDINMPYIFKTINDNFKVIDNLQIIPFQTSIIIEKVLKKCFKEINPENKSFKKSNSFIFDNKKYQFRNYGLIFLSIRLGINTIDEIYFNSIKNIFNCKECIGFIGGKSYKASYFIGCDENNIFYLDPHQAQDSIIPPINENNIQTYLSKNLFQLSIKNLQPAMTIGFLFRDLNEFKDLYQFIMENSNKEGCCFFVQEHFSSANKDSSEESNNANDNEDENDKNNLYVDNNLGDDF